MVYEEEEDWRWKPSVAGTDSVVRRATQRPVFKAHGGRLLIPANDEPQRGGRYVGTATPKSNGTVQEKNVTLYF